jgi:hypothetical protein
MEILEVNEWLPTKQKLIRESAYLVNRGLNGVSELGHGNPVVAKIETLAIRGPRDVGARSVMVGCGPAMTKALNEVAEWRE